MHYAVQDAMQGVMQDAVQQASFTDSSLIDEHARDHRKEAEKDQAQARADSLSIRIEGLKVEMDAELQSIRQMEQERKYIDAEVERRKVVHKVKHAAWRQGITLLDAAHRDVESTEEAMAELRGQLGRKLNLVKSGAALMTGDNKHPAMNDLVFASVCSLGRSLAAVPPSLSFRL